MLGFTLGIILYVSPPDFPYSAKSWGIGLWSEPSGWWSEITWILGFGVTVITTLLFWSWLKRLKPTIDLMVKVHFGTLMVFLSWYLVSTAYMIYYMTAWPGFYKYFLLDTTGTLHGLFYIATVHLAVLSGLYGLGLFARIVEIMQVSINGVTKH